ncbi:MAG TPA: DUF389 domain-containing protein [Flexivirga sp.]|uniref:DUF389 domain-containing protein n=1 Tax=Flexivirga sp. TaxID=1962927 RepID=UPI002CB1AF26|nr:DUF389 domain-containing protein [Flexivirga sp.]HWC21534.1 DUF389 domain-containing protein [Flexivirga sp.]
MLVHLRLTVPEDLTDDVVRLLEARSRVTNLVIQPGVCRDPRGDLVECDTARESAGELVDALRDLGLADRGGIVISRPTGTPFRRAGELEDAAPGEPDDAVIWDEVLASAESASTPTISYHVFLVLATVLAAIAVITDSSVLVVGAMVVSPDFAPVAALCTGVVFGRLGVVWRSAILLVASFVFAIAVVAVLGVIADGTHLINAADVTRPRPQTAFIWHPDHWSFIVALIAGAVGVLAMSTDKTAAMVGVFISVTTVPAAGNLALGLATWQQSEITGSASQLGINLAGLVLAGIVTLAIQRLLWQHVTHAAQLLFGRLP